MSTATDAAELEAAIAEAELTDDETEAVHETMNEGASAEEAIAFVLSQREGGDDDVTPPAPPAEELGEPSAKQLRDLERETDRHLEKVKTIMGGHVAGFDVCDACGAVGLTPPGPRPQSHENYKACPTCQGFGQIKTGSLRGGHEAADCPTCKGSGYLIRREDPNAGAANGAQIVPVPYVPTAEGHELAPPPAAPPTPPAEQWEAATWMGDPSLGPR